MFFILFGWLWGEDDIVDLCYFWVDVDGVVGICVVMEYVLIFGCWVLFFGWLMGLGIGDDCECGWWEVMVVVGVLGEWLIVEEGVFYV